MTRIHYWLIRMDTYITRTRIVILICNIVLVTLTGFGFLCGYTDKQSDRRMLNDVIEYLEKNSGNDESVRLTDFAFYPHNDDKYLDCVYLYYSG